MASAWDCPRCTFANSPASPAAAGAASWREAECAVCGYRRAHVDLDDDDVDARDPEERHVAAGKRDAEWACGVCTLLNEPATARCAASPPPCLALSLAHPSFHLPSLTSPPSPPLPHLPSLTSPPSPPLPHLPSLTSPPSPPLPHLPSLTSPPSPPLPHLPSLTSPPSPPLPHLPPHYRAQLPPAHRNSSDGEGALGAERGSEGGRGAEGEGSGGLKHEERRDGGAEERGSGEKQTGENGGVGRGEECEEAGRGAEGKSGNEWLRLLHEARVKRQGRGDTTVKSTSVSVSASVSIMTWNVWFNEDAALQHRMQAIGAAIQDHRPHVVCLQEVTRSIVELFSSQPWFTEYHPCSPLHDPHMPPYFCLILSRLAVQQQHVHPFTNSIMGRQLLITSFRLPPITSPASSAPPCVLTVATTHLESPCPAPPTWDQFFSPERVQQAAEALRLLDSQQWRERGGGRKRARGENEVRRIGEGEEDVVFCGDMNWNDKRDGDVPLPAGWVDAWLQLHPREEGFTYDSRLNPMLAGGRLRLRLDRCFLHLHHLRLHSLSLLGTHPIPGGSYSKQRRVKGQPTMVDLPLLPSDHYGLLLVFHRGDGGAVGHGDGRAVASGGDGGGGGGGDRSKGDEEQGGGIGERKVSSKKGRTRVKGT
ncbi:unnamed protein product [Closterium sp. Yama58-4]|nr:unnamed protein product [Closterium sp. Yama58-4]